MRVASAAIPIESSAGNGWTPSGTRRLSMKPGSTNSHGRDIGGAVPERDGDRTAGVCRGADEHGQGCWPDDQEVLVLASVVRRPQLVRGRAGETPNLSIVEQTVDVESDQTPGADRVGISSRRARRPVAA